MRKRLGVYEKDDFDTLIDLIERVPGHQLDVRRLMRSLQSFRLAFGQSEKMTGAARIWAEDDETTQIIPKQAALELEKLLSADNPLARGVCPPALRPYLNAKISRRWNKRWRNRNEPHPPSLATVEWDLLRETEREEVFGFIEELRVYFTKRVRRGPPSIDRLDTALEEIGAIWIEQTGWNKALYELPHSENSRFIQFASIAMVDCEKWFETSRLALSRRWKRQKKHSLRQED